MQRQTAAFNKAFVPFSVIIILITVLPYVGFGQFTFGGNASSQGGDCYQLTPATIGNKGYVYRNASISLNNEFSIKFRVNLGTNNNGGDGMMFVLRDTFQAPLIGNAGSNIGFNGPGLDTNSLGVELDTKEDAAKGDIAADHVGIFRDGNNNHGSNKDLAGPVQASAVNVNVEDGNNHTFEIQWDPTIQTLKVFFDCSERLSYTGDIINDIFDGDDEVHWAIFGTTSGSVNVQSFCLPATLEDLFVPVAEEIGVCKDDTVHLVAGDTPALYIWTPSVGLSANNVPNPRAFPVDTTQYVVRATRFCDTIFDTTVVNIIPPNFQTSVSISNATCKDVCDGAIDLSILNGTAGINGYDYLWSTGATSQDISNLCDTAYIVTVQDVNVNSPNYLCKVVDTFSVTEPSLLNADIVNPTLTKCPGSPNCDAEAKVNGSGGTQPYNYYWSSAETNQNANSLCKGFNFVTVYDANGCEAYDTIEIFEPSPIETIGYGDTLICINSIAAIASSSTGGTPPFSYVWREGSLQGPVVSISSSDAVSPVITTEYYVQSFDGNGCTGDTSLVTVKVRPELDVRFVAPDTICPYDTVDITAVGIGGDSIYSFAWETGSFSNVITVSPDETRYYSVTVSDQCGTPFTIDSLKMQVGGYPDIKAHIELEDDSICAGKSLYMIASATGGFRGPDEYRYTWTHNGKRNDIQFIQPFETTEYELRINDLCLSKPDTVKATIYVGNKIRPDLTFTPGVACKQSDVVIGLDEFDRANEYTWIIDTFGALVDYRFDTLLYQFAETGCYDFELRVTSAFGCKSDTFFNCGVEILENPTASFSHQPNRPTNLEPMIDFRNTSVSTADFFWLIDGDTNISDSLFRYEFKERQEPYNVTLFAVSEAGCIDSTSKEFTYFEETIIRYPNSFSPNADGLNDVFLIESEGLQLDDFNLEIFDRLGNQVFRTKRQTHGWDGRRPNGNLVSMGTYYFILRYRDDENIERVLSDKIHIAITGNPTGF